MLEKLAVKEQGPGMLGTHWLAQVGAYFASSDHCLFNWSKEWTQHAMLEKLGLAKGDEEMSSGRFSKRNESN